MKTCYRCQESKAHSMFAIDRSRRDGLQPLCRACKREYAEMVREHRLTRQRERWLERTDIDRENDRQRQRANYDKYYARKAEYQRANRGAANVRNRVHLARMQSETKALAAREREKYEPWEDAIVLDCSRSVKDIALELGRSYSSVAHRKLRLTRKALEEA